MLSNGLFYSIHKSHLVQLSFVKGYRKGKGGYAIMTDGSELPISREKKHDFLRELEPFMK